LCLASSNSGRENVHNRKRRALSWEELQRLIEAAKKGPLKRIRKAYKGGTLPPEVRKEHKEQGERNSLIWMMLAYTGLRVGELRRLIWSDVDLEAGTLTVRADVSKNNEQAVLPLHTDLMETLEKLRRKITSEKEPVVFVPEGLAGNILHRDLELAGIERIDAAGRSVDCHSLRHTFGTLLNSWGVDPKTIQSLMRHKSPHLTFGFYVHTDREKMQEAVACLPSFMKTGEARDGRQVQKKRKTG
jgi:integrase